MSKKKEALAHLTWSKLQAKIALYRAIRDGRTTEEACQEAYKHLLSCMQKHIATKGHPALFTLAIKITYEPFVDAKPEAYDPKAMCDFIDRIQPRSKDK